MKYQEPPYKSADDLQITNEERNGLIDLVPRLLGNSIELRMDNWCLCLRWHLEDALGHISNRSHVLDNLYCGSDGLYDRPKPGRFWDHCSCPVRASPQQAAQAIVRFLSGE